MTALLPAPARTIVYGSSVAPYLQWPVAQPSDTLDYGLDMSSVVTPETDTIIQVVASVQPSGSGELTITQLYVIGNVVVIWLSGGVATRTYQIQLDITTVNARSYSLVAYLPVSSELAVPPVPLPPVAGFGTTTTWTSGGVVVGPFSLVQTGLVGTGTNQATALLLPALTNVVSSAPSGTGFVLPTSLLSGTIIVQDEDVLHAALVYPPVGAQINTLGINAPFSVTSGSRVSFTTQVSAVQWWAA